MSLISICHPLLLVSCNDRIVCLSSTRQPGLLLDFGVRSISQTIWSVFTGYEHPSALSSSWRFVYRPLHGAAPQYLSNQLQYVADLPTRRRGRLRSSTSNLLDVSPSRVCYCRSASSLTTFRRKLKTHLFRQSYPDIVL